ncbi:MAG: hypothetical protein E7317_06790, partial [Clostridiales bacterium]|nr:hypothetical protein [Clostridiales bacterium]
VYAAFASRIYRGIMFHSLTCRKKNVATVYKSAIEDFGQPASHGCIRLRFADAEFICKNCLAGTRVDIYKESEVDTQLRTLLLESSYTNEDGMSYNEYLGLPVDEGEVLSRSSVGDEVTYLQMRLRALGFYDGEIDGEFGTSTVAAVKQVQRAMGEKATGYVTEVGLEKIYDADAPTAMKVTITEGMSGPIVRNLQNRLATLRIYEGEIDGVYDVDVIEAVKTFEQVYGYEADDIATPEEQSAIATEAARLEKTFEGKEYQLDASSESIDMAVIRAQVRVRIREEPNTSSRSLESLKDGTSIMVLERGAEWSRVRYGTTTGYVRNDLMEFQDRTMSCLVYSASDGTTMHIGNNAQEYIEGARLPAAAFSEIYTARMESAAEAAGASETPKKVELEHGLVESAVVNTGNNAVRLNLRDDASSEGKVVAELDNGTPLEVLLKGEEWSLVEVDKNTKGYLLDKYLTYTSQKSTGPAAEDDEDAEDEAPDGTYTDTFSATVYEKCVVYDVDSDDANKIGTLSKGTSVTVLFSDDEWTLVEYKGKQGYIQNEYLQFNMWEEYI